MRTEALHMADVSAVSDCRYPEMTMAAPHPSTELMRLINSYQVSQALHVAAMLGISDHLKDGPKSYDSLAQVCGAHPRSLYRLLRALAAVGVFQESNDKEFSLTPLGACLTSDAPASRRNYARWIGTPGLWRSWGNLLHSIKSGENATQFTLLGYAHILCRVRIGIRKRLRAYDAVRFGSLRQPEDTNRNGLVAWIIRGCPAR